MTESERKEFEGIVEALKNGCPDEEIRKLVEDSRPYLETCVDESGHNIVFYFEMYERDDLWESMVADWEADFIASAMEDYDAALKPYYG